MSMLLKGGRVYINGAFLHRDILIDKGLIVLISEHIEASPSVPFWTAAAKLFFPVLRMFMFICGSRVFLIRRRCGPARWPRRTAGSPPSARCPT